MTKNKGGKIMNRLHALLSAILALMLISATAYAGGGAAAKGDNPGAPMASSSTYSEDELVDLIVVDPAGEKIGQIKNVSKDEETGKISFVTVAEGISLGTSREHAVSLDILNIRSDTGEATLLVSFEKLQSAPTQELGMSNAEFGKVINEYYGIAPAWEEGSDKPEMKGEEKKEYPERSNY
jgi:sporulation protein YlmC with PRC-barrel domain